MDTHKLAEINRELSRPDDRMIDRERLERGSYGLRNVHQRLQLHYGQEAGLRIESADRIGTRVSFTIPVLEEGEKAV